MKDYNDRIEIEMEEWEFDLWSAEIETDNYVAGINERLLVTGVIENYTNGNIR